MLKLFFNFNDFSIIIQDRLGKLINFKAFKNLKALEFNNLLTTNLFISKKLMTYERECFFVIVLSDLPQFSLILIDISCLISQKNSSHLINDL